MKTSIFKFAMSLAASWAWGTSLIVGMELIQSKGIIPFVIWASANSLAIPLFGFLAYKIPNLERIIKSKPIMCFITIVSLFCLWIQMNAIYQQMIKVVGNEYDNVLKIIIILIFVAIGVYLQNNGIKKSVSIDFPLWSICYGVLLCMSIVALINGGEHNTIQIGDSKEDINWAVNSCFILFSGPIMCIQNWQVARVLKSEGKMKAHYLAGVLFAIYMAFVGLLGYYKFNGYMEMLLIIVVVIVAMSTADAAIVGLHEIAGNKVGIIIELVATITWPILISFGVMELWTWMGNMRKYVAVFCILVGFLIEFKKGRHKNEG